MNKIKLSKSIMVFLLMIALIIPSIMPTQITAATKKSTVRLSKKSLKLTVGKSTTLKLANTKKKIKWKTSRKSIATISKTGKVTAKKKGVAIVTATIGKKKYNCKVSVNKYKYGSIKGSVTSYSETDNFESFSYSLPIIMLIPKNANIKSKDNDSIGWLSGSNGVRATEMNYNGEYSMGSLPTGDYIAVIISQKLINGTSNMNSYIDTVMPKYLSDTDLQTFKSSMERRYCVFKEITINGNETLKLNYDFVK